MKKHSQKFFSFLLIVAMMLSLVTSVAFADGASAESVQTQETDTVVQPAPADVPVPAESSPTAVAPAADSGNVAPTPVANPAVEPSTPPTAAPAVDEQGGAPSSDTPADNAPTGDTPTGDTPTGDTPTGDAPTGDAPTGDTPTGDTPTGDTPATTAPVEDPQPSVEPTPVAEDVPSPAAQAFISAVAAISVPETLTEDTYAALSAQVEAAYAALSALSEDDLARADVQAAIATLASVAEVLEGGIDVLTPLYTTLYVDCVVNGEVVKTITLTSGDMYIQVDMQVPYLSVLLKDTKWKDVDYGRVTAVKCSPPAYFPSGLDLHEGQNIQLSNNHQRYQLIYSTSGWDDGSSSTNPSDTPSGKFVIIYNKNCNDTVTNMPANFSTNQQYGTVSTRSEPTSTLMPVREGYTFTGWNTAANGTGTSYGAGGFVTLTLNQPLTLYAQWTKNTPVAETAKATLHYDANGGTGAPADQTATVAKGTYADFQVSSTIPTKDDSTFKGWCDDKDGNGITYKAGQYIGVLAGSTTTLYAQWEKNTITLTYVGGVDDNSVTNLPAAETKTKNADGEVTFIISDTVPLRDGYTFSGWKLLDATFWAKNEITTPIDVTLTAQWTKNSSSGGDDGGDKPSPNPNNTLTLTYDDGVEDDSVTNLPAAETKTKNANGYVEFTISSTTPTRSGYTFKGWKLDENRTLQAGEKLGTNADVTVTAIWEKDSTGGGDDGGDKPSSLKATLNYDANGGTGAPTGETKDADKEKGADFTVSGTVPTWDNHAFTSWNTAADGTGTSYAAGNTISVNAGSTTTLYAQWELIPSGGGDDGGNTDETKATLVYFANYGTFSGGSTYITDTKDADKEKGAEFTVTSTVPTLTECTFDKWTTNVDGSGTSYKAGDKVTVKAGETLNLYAQWKHNPTTGDSLTLTYVGGVNDSSVSNLPAAQTEKKDADGKVTFTVSSQIPTRSGFTFKGWKLGDSTIASGSSFTTSTDVTLTATWEETSEVVTTPDWGKLTVAKSVYPYRPVVVGETLVYTITVTNNTGCALDSVSVYEALDSHLTFVSASCTANTAYNASTGIWTIGSLANSASVTLVVYAKVNYGTPANTVIYNTASISTAVSGAQVIPDGSRNGASANLVVYNSNYCYYNSAYPKTGDDAQVGLWLALMVLSLVCVGVAVVSAKKKIKNR